MMEEAPSAVRQYSAGLAGATETDIVAATTITGDFMCRATNVVYRLDTASARGFLSQFVQLP